MCGSVQLHLQFGSENANSPVHELFTPIKISQLFFVKLITQKIPESIYILDILYIIYIYIYIYIYHCKNQRVSLTQLGLPELH